MTGCGELAICGLLNTGAWLSSVSSHKCMNALTSPPSEAGAGLQLRLLYPEILSSSHLECYVFSIFNGGGNRLSTARIGTDKCGIPGGLGEHVGVDAEIVLPYPVGADP